MSYQPLPTSSSVYPPRNADLLGPPYPLKSSAQRSRKLVLVRYTAGAIIVTVLLHYALLGAFPHSSYTRQFRASESTAPSETAYQYQPVTNEAAVVLEQLDPSAGQPGTFFRDAFPIRSMLAFWDLAEKEVASRKLDTCQGQLGRELIEAYNRHQLGYCLPQGDNDEVRLASKANTNGSAAIHWQEGEPIPPSRIWCAPVHRDDFSKWWPYPAAPCLSTNIRAVQDSSRHYKATGCETTKDGENLVREMGTERFLGSDLEQILPEVSECKELLERTAVVIGRQDQWNPFHVAEDLITTLVTIFIWTKAAPDLANTRVQLVFAEGFGMDSNHFTPLWDRMGAWAPRRLALDPWGADVCLTNTIHSVGAGASLLSAVDIGRPYSCASTITWAASHYYRHLFGLLPPSLSESKTGGTDMRRPINVLWLSRAKLDSYAQKHNDWSMWRDMRHIKNEPELIRRLKRGLQELCDKPNSSPGQGCKFEDAQDVPESWASNSPSLTDESEARPVRFATLDPTVHALETQIHYVGHSTILVSSHGGALGLSLFLPAGDATVIELQVEGVSGNYHFQHMAAQMGHNYELLKIEQVVNVDQVWGSIERQVAKTLQGESSVSV